MASSLASGSQLGKYKLLSRLGTGGMGTVHKALDQETGETVALKVLSAEAAARPTALERFRREAEMGQRLRHPNIVSLYHFGEASGHYYLAMEFIEGIDLARYIQSKGRLSPAQARHILVQLVEALDHAHRRGVIHRDIKPANVLLVPQDPNNRKGPVNAKLADLGLARLDGDEYKITRDGYTVGTIDYMPPEQARHSRSGDIRSDIYSLGCTFYHMLTGAAPFDEGTIMERVRQHAEEPPPDPRCVNPEIPEYLAEICRRMMAKKPDDRFQTPAELLHELRGWDAASTATAAPAAKTRTAQGVAQTLFERAREVISSANYEYGIPLLEDCCRREPGNLEFRQALRDALRDQVRSPAAKSWRNRLGAALARVRFVCARLLKKHASVCYWGERLLAQDPDNVPLQLQLAAAADASGAQELAEWILRQADRSEKRDPRVLRSLALIEEKRDDIPAALELWEAVLKADANNPEARHKLRDLSVRNTIDHGQYRERLTKTRSSRRKET